jgi:protein scribble
LLLIEPIQEMQLTVRHDPSPPGLQELRIPKKSGEKLGISIRGGTKNQFGNPFDKTDEGIFISKIQPNGAVGLDGRLHVGQRILEVNGQSLLGCSHQEAVDALRSVTDVLAISVCDGFDPSLLQTIESGSPAATRASMRFNSDSSIDRDSFELESQSS